MLLLLLLRASTIASCVYAPLPHACARTRFLRRESRSAREQMAIGLAAMGHLSSTSASTYRLLDVCIRLSIYRSIDRSIHAAVTLVTSELREKERVGGARGRTHTEIPSSEAPNSLPDFIPYGGKLPSRSSFLIFKRPHRGLIPYSSTFGQARLSDNMSVPYVGGSSKRQWLKNL